MINAIRELTTLSIFTRVVLAIIIGGMLGSGRERLNRPAGLRTYMLVCLGSAVCMMINQYVAQAYGSGDPVRIGAQVISGIGFLGAGTIFTAQKKISGLTTAAGLWNVACLGLMIGFGYYWLAMGISVLVILVLFLLGRFIRINTVKHVEVKFVNRAESIKFINDYFSQIGVLVLDVDFHVEMLKSVDNKSLYTNIYTLRLPGRVNYTDIVTKLSESAFIHTVRTRSV